jgi:choline dehydrogenase-like flavoprotein
LDAFDFAPHAANPSGGWPLTKADLDPYAAETDAILDLAPRAKPPPYLPADISPFTPIVFRFSPPTRFRTKFHHELARSRQLKVYLNANLLDILPDTSRRSVAELRFRSFHRPDRFSVRAKYFVLCLGGIENPRILLNSQRGDRFAIGNQYDLVGRYFAEHLHYTLGTVIYEKTPPARLFVGPTAALLDRPQILNFGLRIEPPSPIPDSIWRNIACYTSFTKRLARAIGTPDCEPRGLLRIAAEQSLNPDSRIMLTNKIDRFGLRQVALDWRLSPVDRWSIERVAIEWAVFMAKRRLGRVRLTDWIIHSSHPLPVFGQDEVIGNHHLCATRMSENPKEGVVDGNCRVHGVENLYLGGSSVFASAGASNPTYTIVQLALRLADHLAMRRSY